MSWSGDWLNTGTDTGALTFTSTSSVQGTPDREPWKKEWAKFREEFVRKLLAEEPTGVLSFIQERSLHSPYVKVKVTIEYYPDIHEKGKARK